MSRRSKQSYVSREIDELARQLIRAPAERRAEQVRRAERLYDELAPDATYPLDYLIYRITGYRAEREHTLLLTGRAVAADLRLLIDTLSRSIRMMPQSNERLETIAQLAQRLGVSSKTIERWRRDGLRWRWSFDAQRGKTVIVIAREAAERFRTADPARVRRAVGFSRMSLEQRKAVIDAARQAKQQSPALSLNRVAARIARQLGRSHEAIRLLLEEHDANNPGLVIFTGRIGSLTERDGRLIFRARRRGVTLAMLAAHFGKSPSTIRAAEARYRLLRLQRLDLGGFESPLFSRPDADQVYLHSHRAREADRVPRAVTSVPVDHLPIVLRQLYRQPVIDAATQRHLFRRFHYLRFKARRLLASVQSHNPSLSVLNQVDSLAEQATQTLGRLVRANLPVVLSVARRHQLGSESAGEHLYDLLEAGQEELIDAALAFDPFRGQRREFDAYLTNRLLRRFTHLHAGNAARPRARRREDEARLLDRLRLAALRRGVTLDAPR